MIYVRRDSIAYYAKNGQQQALVHITSDAMQDLEIQDATKFKAIIAQFVELQKPKAQRLLVALDESVLFLKVVALTKSTDIQAAVDAFEQKVPFQKDDRHVAHITVGAKLLLSGTNKRLYEVLVAELEARGNTVAGVVPAPVYGIKSTARLEAGKVMHMLADKARLHAANILHVA